MSSPLPSPTPSRETLLVDVFDAVAFAARLAQARCCGDPADEALERSLSAALDMLVAERLWRESLAGGGGASEGAAIDLREAPRDLEPADEHEDGGAGNHA